MYGNSFLDEFKGVFTKPNNGLMKIIVINLVIFLVLLVLEQILKISGSEGIYHIIVAQLMLPSAIESFILKPWTIVTYFFTHEEFFHFAFNMLWLYWFGKLIVEYLGSKKLVNIYVLGGLVGGLAFVLIYNLLPFFANQVQQSRMLGASAGVYAVVVAAATLMPNYTFFLFLIGPVKIKYIALFYVVVSFAQITGMNAGGNLAHLGGALIGFLFISQMQKGVDLGKPITKTFDFVQGFFTKRPKIKVTYNNTSSTTRGRSSSTEYPSGQKANQEEIDLILDKISASGYESLSKEEKQKLFNASKKS